MSISIVPSPEIWDRHDFPVLCNWRKLYTAVEIGVDRGNYSAHFLSLWQGRDYYGVDDYLPYPEMARDREGDYHAALSAYSRHPTRARLVRGKSAEVARSFESGSIDFVYVDASHDYANVMADLRAWWPTLSPQGILAGHDWTDQPIHTGVKAAVTEFATEVNQTVYLTAVPGYGQETCPSWYCYRSGMPDSTWRRC